MNNTDKLRIIAVQPLNGPPGNSAVFGQALQLLRQQLYEVRLFTPNPATFYLIGQAVLFLRILFSIRKKDIVYIDSLLPFGAALAGKLRGCRVVYHIHEAPTRTGWRDKILLRVVNATAWQCIFASDYCRRQTPVHVNGTVVYNALPLSFMGRISGPVPPRQDPFTILMVCPLKTCSGVIRFLECAAALPGVRFELVLEDSHTDVDLSFSGRRLPYNLFLYGAQPDIHPFYSRASMVVDLSIRDQREETSCMTPLKAMYYGRPVIVPPAGEGTEWVEDGSEGFYVDSRKIEDVVTAICILLENKGIYKRMSEAAYRKALSFSKARFDRELTDVFRLLRTEHDLCQSPD